MNLNSTDGQLFLQKISGFVKIAIDEIEAKDNLILQFHKQKAAEALVEDRFIDALEKAADALYDADFINDEAERRGFLKKAKEDPSYLARMIEKLCDAADVASIGTPARVTKPNKEAEYDPVMAKAFGLTRGSFILEEQ